MNWHHNLAAGLALSVGNNSFGQINRIPAQRSHVGKSATEIVPAQNQCAPFWRCDSQEGR